MDEQGRGQAPSYRAFISYSHRDDATARKLHRQLETYRLPKHLVGRETGRGVVPERLVPIFRDLDELSAADDLSAEIKAALARSDVLVILASPAARASKWVNLEIETFRALHGDRRPVLVALAEGEPAEAFPPALTVGGNEPVAADFRREASGGKRLALLKLVAGISGAPLDSLVQRDAQRQLRRVTAITGGALAAALVMALLLFIALRAQADAERQRHEAEGLVEYMLTDLRDKLKGVGRLDVMTAVNERAMQYYGGDSVKAQLLKARTLHAQGEDDDTRGQTASALQKFDEAATLTSKIVSTLPNDQSAIFAQAQSEYWMGYMALKAGRVEETRSRFRRYSRLTSQLTALDPKKPEWLKEAAYADGNLCTAFLIEPQQVETALTFCKKALGQIQQADKLLGSPAETQRSIVNRYVWLAQAYTSKKDELSAMKALLAQQIIAARLVATDPDNATNREVLLKARLAMGRQLDKMNRRSTANRYFKMAQIEADRLVKLESKNSMFQDLKNMAYKSR